MPKRNDRLAAVSIDASIVKTTSNEAAQDLALAIQDLLEGNELNLSNGKPGPYRLLLGTENQRIVMVFSNEAGLHLHSFGLSLKPFQRTVRDYVAICDSYISAVKTNKLQSIEAIDMARRSLHNDGAELLSERLKGKAEMDSHTARRLFTLICAILPVAGAPPQNVAPVILPAHVLFVCTMNAIRSPMAAAITHHFYGSKIYAASAGLMAGDPDPFVSVVMDEIGIDLKTHRPHSLSEDDLDFDLVVTLSEDALDSAQNLMRKQGASREHWPMPDPSLTQGGREQLLDAYRELRDGVLRKVRARFGN